MPVTVKRCKAV